LQAMRGPPCCQLPVRRVRYYTYRSSGLKLIHDPN
jgi:hypothetical protein